MEVLLPQVDGVARIRRGELDGLRLSDVPERVPREITVFPCCSRIKELARRVLG